MLILFLRMALGLDAMNNIKIIFLGFLSLCGLTACTDAGVDVTGNENQVKLSLKFDVTTQEVFDDAHRLYIRFDDESSTANRSSVWP